MNNVSWCKYNQLQEELRIDSAETSRNPKNDYDLAVYYVLPTNIDFSDTVLQRIKTATLTIQGWYQCATGGVTWKLAFPEIVQTYFAQETWQYYRDNGNWWGSLLGEMQGNGLPIWTPGTVVAIWAHGAGWWAGGAQWCGIDCGTALLGVEAFPEFNDPTYSGDTCPGGEGVSAWPCTPEGAYAHELGHTLGLLHPIDIPATEAYAYHSIMQTHWNFPDYAPPSDSPWGFLSLERQTVIGNPFMHENIPIVQQFDNCDIVNLPSLGTPPNVDFDSHEDCLTVDYTNQSVGGNLYYWNFGDMVTSNAQNPIHTYADSGSYSVTLRVSNLEGMTGEMIRVIDPYMCEDNCGDVNNDQLIN